MYHVPKDKRALRSAENLYQGLREVLKSKTFKEVTVSDLQKASGISRSTFYRLFDNPSDLLEWKLDSCLDEVFQAVPAARRSLDLEIIRQFFTYLISQQELLDLLDDIRHPSLIPRCISRFGDKLSNRFDDCIEKDPLRSQYFQSMRLGMLMGIMRTWLDNGHKESVDEMMDIFGDHLYSLALLGQKLGVCTIISGPAAPGSLNTED